SFQSIMHRASHDAFSHDNPRAVDPRTRGCAPAAVLLGKDERDALSTMLELYGHPQSGATRKVRWALEEQGLAYELRTIDLRLGEHRRADYLKMNPSGRVPTLVDGTFVLWESDAILWHTARE